MIKLTCSSSAKPCSEVNGRTRNWNVVLMLDLGGNIVTTKPPPLIQHHFFMGRVGPVKKWEQN